MSVCLSVTLLYLKSSVKVDVSSNKTRTRYAMEWHIMELTSLCGNLVIGLLINFDVASRVTRITC